jgi:hypothetical protein
VFKPCDRIQNIAIISGITNMVKSIHQYHITSPPPGNISVRTDISVFAFFVCFLHFCVHFLHFFPFFVRIFLKFLCV